MACRPSTALCQILRPAGFSFPASCVCFQYRWSPNCGIYPPFDDPPQSGYHGEKAPQGQEPPAPPREGDTSDGASAVFHDAEAEDTRGYSDEVTILLMVLVLVLPPILARFWILRQARHILPLIKILARTGHQTLAWILLIRTES